MQSDYDGNTWGKYIFLLEVCQLNCSSTIMLVMLFHLTKKTCFWLAYWPYPKPPNPNALLAFHYEQLLFYITMLGDKTMNMVRIKDIISNRFHQSLRYLAQYIIHHSTSISLYHIICKIYCARILQWILT